MAGQAMPQGEGEMARKAAVKAKRPRPDHGRGRDAEGIER
jgi:hypothetical protein